MDFTCGGQGGIVRARGVRTGGTGACACGLATTELISLYNILLLYKRKLITLSWGSLLSKADG